MTQTQSHSATLREAERTLIGEFDVTSSDASGLLPAQTSVGVRWDADTSGPLALMLAILADAVQCIEQGRRRRGFRARRLAADAEAWVRSNRRDWPFAFLNVCEMLGFDAHALRTRLFTIRNDASEVRRVRVRAPIRLRAMTYAPELRRVGAEGSR
jgi:hypothetical protein